MLIRSDLFVALAAGCLVFPDIRGVRARRLVLAPGQHAHDDLLRIADSYNRSGSLNSTVEALLESGIQRRDAEPISIPLIPDDSDAYAYYFRSAVDRFKPQSIPYNCRHGLHRLLGLLLDMSHTSMFLPAYWWYMLRACLLITVLFRPKGNKKGVNTPVAPGTKSATFSYENGVTVIR
ncbi:hypothetical protein EVG20_g4080 [Dentipellis fragilis]|uniref:Uncharacterized protein n=1 Tax=Dentipellis fragilis TaxID=205917 RepID=A0A4Y9YZL2_9AGAM|nr:hypothetical protein EVG20_g4080 [Dentipellis fragilis]